MQTSPLVEEAKIVGKSLMQCLWSVFKRAAMSLTMVGCAAHAEVAPPHQISGLVSAVHDGDTFTMSGGKRIRVFGIDAPELLQACRADAIHTPGPSPCVPCGELAREALEALVLGKKVTCTDRGKSYDRVVGECALGNIQIGPWMLTHGWAIAYERFLKKADEPTYLVAQSSAKRANEGIWAITWVPPAQWRRKARLECER